MARPAHPQAYDAVSALEWVRQTHEWAGSCPRCHRQALVGHSPLYEHRDAVRRAVLSLADEHHLGSEHPVYLVEFQQGRTLADADVEARVVNARDGRVLAAWAPRMATLNRLGLGDDRQGEGCLGACPAIRL